MTRETHRPPAAQVETPAAPNKTANTDGAPAKRFGTFGGVFTPSLLTILGVVMYLRFGWVVGNAGLLGALLIVFVSHMISFSTGLSVASIATNRTVGAGGAYYMISRSLGAPAGAAIGIPLFLGQALSVSFYVVGFTESLAQLFPSLPAKAVSLGVCLLLTAISLKSADLAIKAQYVVLGLIGLSIVSFFAGTSPDAPSTIVWGAPESGESFGTVFAVFFPAVTGIMAGVGMSGDLKDPRRSLPRGTLWAITAGLVVYSVFPIWLAYNANTAALQTDDGIVWKIARFKSLIYLGVWGATISSAVGSLLTAPRTLQALAQDGLAPRFMGRGSGPHNEPRVGIAFTFLLAAGGILLGNLNAIANILTMFFLATYGLTNLACGLERWAASPSFRPDFRIPSWVSLAGALACFYVMSVIDLVAMVVALMFSGAIYAFTQRRALGTTYGDARHGIWSALVRTALHKLRNAAFHPLNWRPNLVIMGGGVEERPHLLELGSTIVQDRGVVTYFHLLRGSVDEHADTRRELLERIDTQVAADYPNVFFRVDIVENIYRGVVNVAQSYGVGKFEANTVILGWPKNPEKRPHYAEMLLDLTKLDRSLLLVNFRQDYKFGLYRQIHIWWGGLQGNGGLMLLLAFLITAHDRWRGASVRIMTVVNSEEERASGTAAIRDVLTSARVPAEPRVILRDGRTIPEIMRTESTGADLAIIGIRLPERGDDAGRFFERMTPLLNELPSTIMVHSATHFQGAPVLFQD